MYDSLHFEIEYKDRKCKYTYTKLSFENKFQNNNKRQLNSLKTDI